MSLLLMLISDITYFIFEIVCVPRDRTLTVRLVVSALSISWPQSVLLCRQVLLQLTSVECVQTVFGWCVLSSHRSFDAVSCHYIVNSQLKTEVRESSLP